MLTNVFWRKKEEDVTLSKLFCLSLKITQNDSIVFVSSKLVLGFEETFQHVYSWLNNCIFFDDDNGSRIQIMEKQQQQHQQIKQKKNFIQFHCGKKLLYGNFSWYNVCCVHC